MIADSGIVLTALNLTTLAAEGPLPATHIPKHRTFKVSHLAPFATNVHFQRTPFTFSPSLLFSHPS